MAINFRIDIPDRKKSTYVIPGPPITSLTSSF